MRELKFRVWNKTMRQYRHFVLQKGVSVSIGADLEIEQYTGLKDKNGKEICEGDIVKYQTVYEGETVKGKGVVNFGNLDDTDGWTNGGYLCWRIDDWLSLNYGGRWIWVVGNIHENPELIGEEKA